jgi:hypothetical protein
MSISGLIDELVGLHVPYNQAVATFPFENYATQVTYPETSACLDIPFDDHMYG